MAPPREDAHRVGAGFWPLTGSFASKGALGQDGCQDEFRLVDDILVTLALMAALRVYAVEFFVTLQAVRGGQAAQVIKVIVEDLAPLFVIPRGGTTVGAAIPAGDKDQGP